MPKDCDFHSCERPKFFWWWDSDSCERPNLFRRLLYAIVVLLVIILLTILIIWAILTPNKPKFVLQDATIYDFNVTTPNLLTSTFQVTIYSRNPNDKIGIYYDKLEFYATYRGQQITQRTMIQPTYQGHKEVNIWSPYVYGNAIPVAPYNAVALSQDQAYGNVLVIIKATGRVRFKVGTYVSGRYHLYVKCPAYIRFGTGTVEINNAVKYQLVQSCSVSV